MKSSEMRQTKRSLAQSLGGQEILRMLGIGHFSPASSQERLKAGVANWSLQAKSGPSSVFV